MAKQFEYEQQLEHLKMPIEDIKKMLDDKPVLYAGIIHDKDEAEKHLHIMVKLMHSDMTADSLCKWFNDEPQFINIKQSKWGNKLSYLCHRTESSKHKYQYDFTEVFANFDYVAEMEKITSDVAKSKKIDEILEEISKGNIRGYNVTDFVDTKTYARYKNQINNALEWYRRKVMTDKDRNILVIMISGPAGVGKTTYAKQYCKNRNKSFCISSSSNDPMQDYEGEDILILDDIRDDAFKYHDLLKLLDNHTKSSTASRYNNKAFIGDTIIMTSSKSILDWYPGISSQDKKQLYRRVTMLLEMTEYSIRVYEYDAIEQHYKEISTIPNVYKMTVKENKRKIVDVLKAFGMQITPEIEQTIMNARSDEDDKSLMDVIDDDEDLPF